MNHPHQQGQPYQGQPYQGQQQPGQPPYQGQPYQGGPGPYPQHPHPYGPPQGPQPGATRHGPPPRPSGQEREEVGQIRGLLAGSVDALVTVIGGFTFATLLFGEKTGVAYWLPAVGCLVTVSFVNHVLLTVPVRASLGKLLLNVRLIRMADGGRPRFWQAVRRWLAGFFYQPIQYLLSQVHMQSDTDGEDLCGLLKVH